MQQISELEHTLKQNGYSNTKTRAKIFAVLARCEPITLPALADQVKGSANRASVYRTIELFEKLGIVHRIWQGFKSRIELSDAYAPHHHHITCTNCGRTINLESKKLEALLAEIAEEHGVNIIDHQVEITGLCQNCQISRKYQK